MITLSDSAQEHFAKLVEQQGIAGLGIRLRAVDPGTPKGDCHLEFCEPADLDGTEWEVECRGFSLYVDSMSRPYLDGATIDFDRSPTGIQLTIKAPALRGNPPGEDAAVVPDGARAGPARIWLCRKRAEMPRLAISTPNGWLRLSVDADAHPEHVG